MSTDLTQRKFQKRHPSEVNDAREILEIVRDFTDPRDVIREAISNSLDWGATDIKVTVEEDKTRPEEELIITIYDNGVGLNEERLHAFFDLAKSPKPDPPLRSNPIGNKGHGTKTYFNSREIEVESQSKDLYVYGLMREPIRKLLQDELPEAEYDLEKKLTKKTYTKVTIRGYNSNQNKRDFGHKALKDYVLWSTKSGSVETEFGITNHKKDALYLRGLGWEGFSLDEENHGKIPFGHNFPKENSNISQLQEDRPGDWTKVFVKRWIFKNEPVLNNPGKTLDIVFYIEGDEAKRAYNPMIRVRGKTPEYGMYKVEERYGLWACKDYIPIKRVNEWLGLGKRLETKYHAFVNCQDFRLTANRGDIGNTPPDLLKEIENTVRTIFEERILGSREYQEYQEAAELEEQYQTAEQEKRDFERRKDRAKSKKVSTYRGLDLIEPISETGVIALFNQIIALKPDVFPFRVVDYDSRRGYDALVAQPFTGDLSRDSLYFIEFKYILEPDFNHSFDHLAAVICWDSKLNDGADAADIRDKYRKLKITPRGGKKDYTKYMLVSSSERHNIEVFVLKSYLKEKLSLDFKPKPSRDRG